MSRSLRFLILSAMLLCGMIFASPAQQLPPVPSKVLPTAKPSAAPVRTHRSPKTGRTYAIRVEPKEFDSDAEEAAEIERNKALRKSAPPALARKEAAKKFGAPKKAAPAAPTTDIPDSEFYEGTDRKAAKLSVANGPPESLNDIADVIATLPPKDSMVHHTPTITTHANSGRVTEENRNVRVPCWLYACSRENDNDYHLILGRANTLTPETYMTAEVSGLPPTDADSFSQLFSARKSFNEFFGANLPGPSYDFYDPPIPVIVEGSLFFDITHAHGTPPGPSSLRPNMPVIWEVHPVTRIEFEPTS
jgi:hypothetical protein